MRHKLPKRKEWSTSHKDLAESLARHLEAMESRLVWTGDGIGSRWLQGGHIPVPDVFTMQKSYTRPDLTAYEAKVDLRDLHADIREGKYRRYFEISNRLFFAYWSGMCKASEIPAECGVIAYTPGKGSWSVQRAAPRRECNLDRLEWQSLLFALKERRSHVRRLSDRLADEDNAALLERARKLGYDVREKLRRASGEDEQDAAEVMEAVRGVFGDKGSAYDVKHLLLSLKSFQEHHALAGKAVGCLNGLLAGLDKETGWHAKQLHAFRDAIGETEV